MKRKHIFLILLLAMGIQTVRGQEFDIVMTSPESGAKTHYARNSITLGANYSYTPSGGSLTAEIQNPIVAGDMYYGSVVDPETRSLNTSYLVGATQGAFDVSPAGGATYTIPIDVLPGVAGLQPSLTITYNSMGGPGVVGYGWNISGISAITRTGKTYYHDGVAGGVNLDSNDRFSLDGQRLVCTSGSYGGSGSQYRTDNDIFTRVTCTADGNGPTQFLAETKSGLDCQYGYDSDADQTIDGHSQVVNWYMSKVTDAYGNQMNYEYIKDNGSVYLGEITYGPNTVTFYYKQRSDKTTAYLKGSKIEQNLVLDKIEVKYNSSVVKKYEFKYNYPYSNYTRYSVLNEVIEYGVGGSRMNSTAFTYHQPGNIALGAETYLHTQADLSSNFNLYTGDFNGDGRGDIFAVKKSNLKDWRLFIGKDSWGYFDLSASGTSDYEIDQAIPTDLNGDGLDDIVLIDIDKVLFLGLSTFVYAISAGDHFNSFTLATRSIIDRYYIAWYNYSSDFDGDGVSDLFVKSKDDGNNKLNVYSLYTTTLHSTMQLKYSASIPSWGDKSYVGDFNGDGKTDIWVLDSNGLKIYTVNGNSLTQLYSSTWPTKDHHLQLGDFNGDGKTDMFLYGSGTYDWSEWQTRLSTGTGFEAHYFTRKKTNLKDDNVYTGDFNADGRTDVLALSKNTSNNPRQYYFISNLNGDNMSSQYQENTYLNKDYGYSLGDFNGDGKTDILSTPSSTGFRRMVTTGATDLLLKFIGDGLGNTIEPVYSKLTNPYCYEKGTATASFPVFKYQGPLTVVNRVWYNDCAAKSFEYTYKGLRIHRQGKGMLGFAQINETEHLSGIVTESQSGYNTTYYYPQVTTVTKKTTGGTVIETTSNTWTQKVLDAPTKRILPYISTSVQTNNLTGQSVTTSISGLDDYGNPGTVTKTYKQGTTTEGSEAVTRIYNNNTTSWLLGRPTKTTTVYTRGSESITRVIDREFSATSNRDTAEVHFPGTDKQIRYSHVYYPNGNLKKEMATAGGVSRPTTYTYAADNVRVQTTTDPLGHTATQNYDSYGRLQSEVDYLSNTTAYTYDNMGRVATQTQPDGFVTTTAYNWGLTDGPTNACYYVQQSGNDGSLSKTWHDKLGREIRSDVKGFSGADIYTVTEYNNKNQVYRVSEPSASVSPSQWNTNGYDNYGRITSITRPSGRNATFAYSNNRVTETTGGKTSWKETDSQGLLTKAHDNGGDIVYAYYPDGKVKTITAPGSVVTTMEYNDAARNQTKLVDPSAGTIEYTYDSFGQIKTQKNARNQTTTYNYHADGRLDTKVSPEGATVYSYNGNKQLTGISAPGSVSRNYGYDMKGRIDSISETIPGSSTFSTIFTYDSKGRMETRTHPSGIVETSNYNSYGYLASISAGGATRFTVTAMNERQQITAATYGSSLYGTFGFDSYGYPTYSKAQNSGTYRQDYRYSFNGVTGNLNSRENYLRSKSESFAYDNLDRLTGVTGPQNLTMDYAANGNITVKSDVGSVFDYNHPTKPYALTGVETSSGLVPDALQVATYTSFEQVSTIDEGDYHAAFTYNSDGQRAKMLVTNLGSTILTRWYVGSRYIKETEGAVTKEYTWIGGDAYTAPVVAVKEGANTSWYYLLRDYLGNITHVVNTSNTVTAEYSYDAWGRRRDKDDWSYTLSGEPDLLAGRSFTSHEYLPWFEQYNMNGRLYDPVVGRFLSADPYVQNPDGTQSYNRYSYCLNNPLKYADISGYTWGIFKPFVKAAKWIGNNISSVATGVYLAAAAVTTVFCPPAGLAMLGAYIGGAQANGWELNAGNWNWKSFETYAGIFVGGLAGYVAGYGLVHPGSVEYTFGASIAGIVDIGVSLGNNDWDVSWSTAAGGGGNYNLNGRNTTPEEITNRAIDAAIGGWNSNVNGMGVKDYIISPSGARYGIEPYTGHSIITGTPPIPGFPKGVKIIQYGGHTLEKGTLKALNITKEEGKFAIESMKKANNLSPNFHGNIGSDGSFWSKTWEYIDNILDYLY